MIEFAGSLWALIVKVGSDLGVAWQAALAGLALSLAATQSLKPWLVEIVEAHRQRITIRALAFVTACLPVVILEPTKWGIVAGLLVGCASPTLYNVSAWIVAKRWPDLAERLSADSIAARRQERDL